LKGFDFVIKSNAKLIYFSQLITAPFTLFIIHARQKRERKNTLKSQAPSEGGLILRVMSALGEKQI